MCKYKSPDGYCVLSNEVCNQKSYNECDVYNSYEEMIRE